MDQQIFGSLTTLINKVEFTKPFADYILGRANIHCTDFHPGKGCLQFTTFKLKQQFINAAKLQFFFIILPALLSYKRILEQPKQEAKKFASKFIKATLFITSIGTIPWMYFCLLGVVKPGGISNKDTIHNSISSGIGMTIGLLLEPLQKHEQYVGFFIPKVV